MFKSIFICLVVASLALSCNSDTDEQVTTGETSQDSIDIELQQFIDDMYKPHESKPSGVPDIGWDDGPRVGYGNTPPEGWEGMIPWGQVYTDEIGNPSENVRFQIRNLQTWYLSKSEGKWVEWSRSSNIGGANYAEDFQNDANIPADIINESESGGGISATLVEGYNFHFWPKEGRVSIDSADIAGVWSAVDARLIVKNPTQEDDLENARLMMSVGADYWLNLSTPWDQWTTNGDIFIGRFRFMTKEWQRFHGHTLTMSQIENGPLPPFRME